MPDKSAELEASHQDFAFGDFVLDLERSVLRRSGKYVKLRAQTFEVLVYLVKHHGVLVSKEELLDAVWHGAAVTDDSITQCIAEIRKVLRDSSRAKIRTVPKRGFVFELAVNEIAHQDVGEATPPNATSYVTRLVWMGMVAVAVVFTVVLDLRSPEDIPDSAPARIETAVTPLPRSIAVLAFEDMSESRDQQYFGDGVADEILSQLAQFPDLNVIARTSSFLFRNQDVDIAAIADELNVGHVLEGSVRKSGNRLRIIAQLIEAENGTHIWSKTFDRESTVQNVLNIQTEVASSVAQAIGSGAPQRDQQPDPVRRGANEESYNLYLEGMFHLRQIETSSNVAHATRHFDLAIERFGAAIELEPSWAPPHGALGRTLHFQASILNDDRTDDRYRLSKMHLLEAIRLDPDYALAYSSLAFVLYQWEFDFAGSTAAFLRARELGGYSPWGYALFLRGLGRFDEAIEQYLLAIERDPLSPGPRHQLASTYHCAGRYEESIAELEKVLRLAPEKTDLHISLAFLHLKIGNLRKGKNLFERYRDPESSTTRYGTIHALLGNVDEAYDVLDIALSNDSRQLIDVVSTALILGEEERAFEYMEAAARADPRTLVNVHCIDGIESVADNSRFQRVLKLAGFPE